MQTFKINENLEVVCERGKTRNGFKHTATLMRDGREIDSVKICYLNRTYERYTYESVMRKLLEKTNVLDGDKIGGFLDLLSREESEHSPLKTIAAVAALGDIFHSDKSGGNQKARNDWKTRMLKAGLEGRGLIMPDDWDTLSEEVKEARLNGALAQLQ